MSGHSWWNFLPSFNSSFDGKCSDLAFVMACHGLHCRFDLGSCFYFSLCTPERHRDSDNLQSSYGPGISNSHSCICFDLSHVIVCTNLPTHHGMNLTINFLIQLPRFLHLFDHVVNVPTACSHQRLCEGGKFSGCKGCGSIQK